MENFRMPGEFEKQSSVLIIWSLREWATPTLNIDNVSTNIVLALVSEVEVIVCCNDNVVESRAKKALEKSGCDISRVRFVQYPCEIPYSRDFGAEILTNDEGKFKNIDFRFDMYGYYDEEDEISSRLCKFSDFHANIIGVQDNVAAKIISEGGDHEFNGQGIMMSTLETEITKRNPDWRQEQVELEFYRVFDVKKIIWLPRCSYLDEHSCYGAIPAEDGSFSAYRSSSANGHIDEICRFADANTIIIASITAEEATQNILHKLEKVRLDEAYNIISNEVDLSGNPFRILKMPVPEAIYITLSGENYNYWTDKDLIVDTLDDGTPYPELPIKVLPAMSYCNFLICNNVVLVAKYYEEGMAEIIKKKDSQAVQVLQAAFPQRKIIPINPLALNVYGGGIHCHTRNIPAK